MHSNPKMPFWINEDNEVIYRDQQIGVVGLVDGKRVMRIERPVDINVRDLECLKGLAIWIAVMYDHNPQQKEPS